MQLEKNYHFQLYKRYPIVLQRAIGTKVYDMDGNEYLDALGGIAVNSVGHCHPKVVEALKKQSEKLIHCSNLYYNEEQSILAEKLCKLSGMERVFFCNSGAEAVEGAIKLARKYGKQEGKNGEIFSFRNCFHGRTLATIAMGKPAYQEGFNPMPEGFAQLEFNNIDMIRKKINKNTIAVVIEPVQGEGGIIPAELDFLNDLRELCNETDTLLVFDEIQCGLGRTGSFFAYQKLNVKPDIVTIAKALGGGMPIGAVLATEKLSSVLSPGDHGTTFGGNPLATAAANATLQIIHDENLAVEAEKKGKYFLEQMNKKTTEINCIKDIRSIGLMIGVELDFKCASVVENMLELGVLANCAAEYVIRLLPPLTISYEEIDIIVDSIIKSIRKVVGNG
jgi:acetylornithine/N-succinyldiaminopimelate aminotransferase